MQPFAVTSSHKKLWALALFIFLIPNLFFDSNQRAVVLSCIPTVLFALHSKSHFNVPVHVFKCDSCTVLYTVYIRKIFYNVTRPLLHNLQAFTRLKALLKFLCAQCILLYSPPLTLHYYMYCNPASTEKIFSEFFF
jgi:hypothetical protein